MSDTDRLYRVLKAAGSDGVHTLDLRREGYSGNPSQRATDVEKKFGVKVHREIERRNGRNGSRYKLISEGVGVGGDDDAGSRPPIQSGPRSRSALSAHSDTPEGQLFQLPSRSAFTDSEWAA